MRYRLPWLPPLLLAAFIFYLSSLPGAGVPPLFPHADKVIHFCLYYLLAALMLRALWVGKQRITIMLGLCAVAIATLYGGSDEWHQLYVDGRTAEVGDWIADALGAMAGVYCYSLYRVRIALRAKSKS